MTDYSIIVKYNYLSAAVYYLGVTEIENMPNAFRWFHLNIFYSEIIVYVLPVQCKLLFLIVIHCYRPI